MREEGELVRFECRIPNAEFKIQVIMKLKTPTS
jgi:hypothetical protein